MPGCLVSATTARFISVENRRRRATPGIPSTFENVSDIGVCLGLSLGPPAIAGVRSKQGALHHVPICTCLTVKCMAEDGLLAAGHPSSQSPFPGVVQAERTDDATHG